MFGHLASSQTVARRCSRTPGGRRRTARRPHRGAQPRGLAAAGSGAALALALTPSLIAVMPCGVTYSGRCARRGRPGCLEFAHVCPSSEGALYVAGNAIGAALAARRGSEGLAGTPRARPSGLPARRPARRARRTPSEPRRAALLTPMLTRWLAPAGLRCAGATSFARRVGRIQRGAALKCSSRAARRSGVPISSQVPVWSSPLTRPARSADRSSGASLKMRRCNRRTVRGGRRRVRKT